MSAWPHELPKDGMVTIRPSGEIVLHAGITSEPELRLLQQEVGGYIEAAFRGWFCGREVVAYCNEEGKLQGLPLNPVATVLVTAMWLEAAGISWDDVLVGNLVVLTGSVAKEDEEPDDDPRS